MWALSLALLGTIGLVAGDQAVFVDNASGSFFRAVAEGQEQAPLTSRAFAATAAALLGVAPPVSIDWETNQQMEALLAPNLFYRPRAVLIASVAGIPEDVLSEMNAAGGFMGHEQSWSWPLGAEDPAAMLRLVDAVPDAAGVPVEKHLLQCGKKCDKLCVEKALMKQSGLVGAEYTPAPGAPMLGTLRFPPGPHGEAVELELADPEEGAWAVELACILRATLMLSEADAGAPPPYPLLIEASVAGLRALRDARGADSAALGAAARAVVKALAHVVEALQASYGGEMVAQVAVLDTPTAAAALIERQGAQAEEAGAREEEAVAAQRRRLHQTPPAPGPDGQSEWAAKALMVSVAVIVLVSTLAGIYCMCYMSVGQDTLLYGGSKQD
eukprot:CAMPEP_0182914084 /NCGR_PEP_ID=MMETSP0034_2-20130328/38368_1 /TAXON_ID=156128 /ORGANISM="Nephroselmis pyriformis, Strain CCMP717" /LENGTH=384 /DNA_ID=CAMNT_0025050817 /DNA_START=16 /DNA_END=1170 /DNA_ORIENTATION=+